MCGIVGLFLKDPALEPELGHLTAGMLETMTDRGPDSAGFAVYGAGADGRTKFTVRGSSSSDIEETVSKIKGAFSSAEATLHDTHAVITIPAQDADRLDAWLADSCPDAEIVGRGNRMEIFKEVGLPADVAQRFGLATMHGTHAIGHTRMATESAVTTDGAPPYSTGQDQCLVHNGSLSNHN